MFQRVTPVPFSTSFVSSRVAAAATPSANAEARVVGFVATGGPLVAVATFLRSSVAVPGIGATTHPGVGVGAVVPVDAANASAAIPAVDAATACLRPTLGEPGPPVLAVLVLVVAEATVPLTEAAVEGPTEVGSPIGLDAAYLPEAGPSVRAVAEAVARPEASKGDVRPARPSTTWLQACADVAPARAAKARRPAEVALIAATGLQVLRPEPRPHTCRVALLEASVGATADEVVTAIPEVKEAVAVPGPGVVAAAVGLGPAPRRS